MTNRPIHRRSLPVAALLIAILCSAAGATGGPVAAQSPAAPGKTGGAPTVFYRTVGGGSDRLYRRVLDGTHLPELLAERPASYAPDDPTGSWWVSPDGTVALRLGRLPDAADDGWPFDDLQAIPLLGSAPDWRLAGRFLEAAVTAWSPDGRLVSDGRSLTDVTAGTTRDLDGPEDSEFLGFVADGDGLLYRTGGGRDGDGVLWRLDPTAGTLASVPWGSVRSTGATWPTSSSTLLARQAISDEDPETGEPRHLLRDLRTGEDTPITGLADRASVLGFDPTGRIAIFEAMARRETGIPPRRATVIQGVADGVTTTLWQGPSGYHEERVLSADGRYLLFQPHYQDPDLVLVSLDGSGSVTIPMPGDATQVTPLRVIPGTLPPSDLLGLPAPQSTPPGELVEGAPSLLVTSMEEGLDGSRIARVRLVSPSTGGTLVRAETTMPMPPTGDVESMDVTAAPRPGSSDVLILVGRWQGPWIYRWTPGEDARRVDSLDGHKALYSPLWSPDGRHLAIRVGSSGRRYAVFDADLHPERTIVLPRDWTNADLVGWTADSRRLVFEPPIVGYASLVAAGPVCENRRPVALVSIATGRLVAKRGTRELSVRLDTQRASRGATGEWLSRDERRRSLAFEHGCPVTSSRSEIEVGRDQLWDTRWSPNGTSLHVLVGRGPGSRVLTYRRPWADPDQEPRIAEPGSAVLHLGPAAPGGRWLAVRGEGRLDGRNAGLLDLRSGEIHWLADPGTFQAWVDAPRG